MKDWIKIGQIIFLAYSVILIIFLLQPEAAILLAIPVGIGGAYIIGIYFLAGYTITSKKIYFKIILGIIALIYIIAIPWFVFFR